MIADPPQAAPGANDLISLIRRRRIGEFRYPGYDQADEAVEQSPDPRRRPA